MNELDELDTSYLADPNSQAQVEEEVQFLRDLAQNVGNYLYEYKDQFKGENGANDKLNLGIMAQQIAKVPGLNAAVVPNPNGDGTLSVDAGRLALTTIGYVATLAKLVLGGVDYGRSDKQVAGYVSDSRGTDSGRGNSDATGERGTTGQISESTGDVPMETSTDETDVYAAATNSLNGVR